MVQETASGCKIRSSISLSIELYFSLICLYISNLFCTLYLILAGVCVCVFVVVFEKVSVRTHITNICLFASNICCSYSSNLIFNLFDNDVDLFNWNLEW